MEVRKYAIGLIVGAVLMYSGQAVAESVSKIGKKVQAEYNVKVDGKVLNTKALAVDNQTYTPNRVLADAIGYDIAFSNKEVVFNKKPGSIGVNLSAINLISSDDLVKLRKSEDQIRIITEQIKEQERILTGLDSDLKIATGELGAAVDKNQKQVAEARISGIISSTETTKERLKNIQSKLQNETDVIVSIRSKY
ncbi:hypothetical protein [Cohnella cellulosilytica]|uniref:Copper amine oxidase-like N-terminal domain-containing protein n=1 Tax=Cohnella cellulosilytica TaxID=986710 RepID=A0ABW2FE84_9BACL